MARSKLRNRRQSGRVVQYNPDGTGLEYGTLDVQIVTTSPASIAAQAGLVRAQVNGADLELTLPPIETMEDGEIIQVVREDVVFSPNNVVNVLKSDVDPDGVIGPGFNGIVLVPGEQALFQRIGDNWFLVDGNPFGALNQTDASLGLAPVSLGVSLRGTIAGFGPLATLPAKTILIDPTFTEDGGATGPVSYNPLTGLITFNTGSLGHYRVSATVTVEMLTSAPQTVGLEIVDAGAVFVPAPTLENAVSGDAGGDDIRTLAVTGTLPVVLAGQTVGLGLGGGGGADTVDILFADLQVQRLEN